MKHKFVERLGYRRDEYFAPERREGTLRCHYRHRAHNDPLLWPGLQDITAWVDFDALADAATSCGFTARAAMSQSEFLIGNGLQDVFADAYGAAPDERTRYALAQEIKKLTLPSEMGENFRVMLLQR